LLESRLADELCKIRNVVKKNYFMNGRNLRNNIFFKD